MSQMVPRTVPTRLTHWAGQQPQRPAYIFRSPSIGRMTLSRLQVKNMAFTFAARLTAVGLENGNVVCNTLQNCPERVVTDLGILSHGSVLVDKRVFVRDLSDMMHVLNQSQARLLIVDPTESLKDGLPSAWEAVRSRCSYVSEIDPATGCITVTWPDVTFLTHVMLCARGKTGEEFDFLKSVEQTSINQEQQEKGAGVKSTDLAVLFPTSGSTGLPKLTSFTQASVLDMADNWHSVFALQDNDIIFQDRPLGWVASFYLPYLSSGTARVMTDGRTQATESYPESLWASITQEGVTFAHLTPQMVSRLLARADLVSQRPASLQQLLLSGQPIKQSFASHVLTTFKGLVLCNAYGLTEMGYLTAFRCSEAAGFLDYLVGFGHPRAQMRVVDDQLRPVERGIPGEVLVRSQGQFQSYYREEQKTRQALLEDGWFRTDDMGYMDEEGRLYMLGRRSDAIMRGVVIVYPFAIEKRMTRISGVQDVLVVGVPDPELYNEICACVVLSPGSYLTAEGLRQQCDDVSLDWHTDLPVPKYVLLFEAFPTTATGKASRSLTQHQACQRLGLQQD